MCLLLYFTLLISFQSISQVADRYNYVQRPTDTSVTIAWRSVNTSVGTIEWGLAPGSLTNSLTESGATTKHYFDISGLTPNTLYYYQTTSDLGYISSVDHFYTAKPDSAIPFSFLHYGDCGYDNAIQNSIGMLMEADNADFGIVAGDVDQGVGDNYDDVFFGVYQNMLKKSCHFTAIGNHDTYVDNAATYLDNFYLPSNNPQGSERYYSFYWGNAKFICLDSNIPYTAGTDQYNWLVDEMSCNPYQLLFVFFHHPPWTNAWSADYYLPLSEYFWYQGNEDMRTDLVPLFEDYDVDFVLNGHSHCYQRGTLNDVQYIISGGAGSALMDFNTNSNSPNIDTEIYTNQYVRFEINGDTAKYYSIDDNDNIIDEVTTVKPYAQPPVPTITFVGVVLTSSPGNSYVWYLDGIQIMGATSQNYTPTEVGDYTVQITSASGCTLLSEAFNIPTVGLNSSALSALKVYPNPSNGIFTVEGVEDFQSATITIVDAMAKTIYSMLMEHSSEKLNLSNVKSGIYFMMIKGNRTVHKEVIVIR